MSRNRLGILVIVAVGLAAAAGTLTARWVNRNAQPVPPPKSEEPALTVDPRYLDFGEVWETDQFEWTAPVCNRTEAPLQVSSFGSSCSCVSATSTKVIPAGGTAPLTFRIDLRQQCAGAEPQAVRDAKIQVALGRDTSPTEKPVPVELRGRVKSAIVVPARSIDFGRFPATATAKPRVVPIRSLVGLRELVVSVEGLSVVAEVKPLAADKWELHVRPSSPLVVGRHEAKVRLTPTTTAGEQVPPITLPVAFDVLHDIQPDSPFLPLGVGAPGEQLSGTLTLASLSGQAFPLPTCEGIDLSVTVAASTPQSHTFKIERRVTAVGHHIAPVVVRGRDRSGQHFEYRVEVQWCGVSPEQGAR